MPEEDDDDIQLICLPFDLLASLFDLASEAEKYLADALNGKPAELLRQMAILLDAIQAKFMSLGYVDQNDQELGTADQYDLFGQALENIEYKNEVTVRIADKAIYLTSKRRTTEH